jgi:phosphate transport system ATP-binding protein
MIWINLRLRILTCIIAIFRPEECRAAYSRAEITALIGPSGCGKSTLLKTLNRMNDLIEGCRIVGTVLLDGEIFTGYGRQRIAPQRRHGVSEAQPLSNEVYDNVPTARARTASTQRPSLMILWRARSQRAIWDELKDR